MFSFLWDFHLGVSIALYKDCTSYQIRIVRTLKISYIVILCASIIEIMKSRIGRDALSWNLERFVPTMPRT